VESERTIEEILDTIGDEKARDILAAITEDPRSAKELGDTLEMSLPTVYRRIELLQEQDLIKSRTYVADDGNHYDVYESNFDSTVIRLEDDTGEYDIRIYRKENVPDRFASLWDDLSPE
jgi:predicted transcriptional regulator